MGDVATWDPVTLADAPRARSALPVSVRPPSAAPSVLEEPLAAAVLAYPTEGRDLLLLGTDGQWRSVPDTADVAADTLRPWLTPALTADGGTLAVPSDDGVLVVDLAAGRQELLPWPARIAGTWDSAPQLTWLPGEEELLVGAWNGTWVMGLDGSDRAAPYQGAFGAGVVVDPDGAVRQYRWQSRQLLEWDGGDVVSRVFGSWVFGERYTTRHGLLAFTGKPNGDDVAGPDRAGVVVVRTKDAETVAYAPTRDEASVYSDNGHLTAVGFLDDHTVVLLVGPADLVDADGAQRWFVATWDLTEDSFAVLAEGGPDLGRAGLAVDALR